MKSFVDFICNNNTDIKTNFWFNNQKNLMVIGDAGFGNTTFVLGSFQRLGLVLDEDVIRYSPHDKDFVGDPTKAKVLYFDNLNDEKSQQAVHEIVNFKSWKGKPVSAMIWGSYTEDLTYPEPMTAGQIILRGCFQVLVESPRKIHNDWIHYLFDGVMTQPGVDAALKWREELTEEYKTLVPPKRLVDALKVWAERGDCRDILPVNSNATKLVTAIANARQKYSDENPK